MRRSGLAKKTFGERGPGRNGPGFVVFAPTPAAQDPWPKRFEHPEGVVVMYQPQLEYFKDGILTGRAAVSVQKKAWKAPCVRAIWLSGRVQTDRETRMATIDAVKVTEARFPDAKPEQMEKLTVFLNTEMAGWSVPIAPGPVAGRAGVGGKGPGRGPWPQKRPA